ncbi:hypothetical protein ERO13_A01G150218v2, partial [Gossypium hirsutum]
DFYLFYPFSYIVFSLKTRFSYIFSSIKHPKKHLFASLYKASTILSFSSFNYFYHLKAFNLLFFFNQFFPYTM